MLRKNRGHIVPASFHKSRDRERKYDYVERIKKEMDRIL